MVLNFVIKINFTLFHFNNIIKLGDIMIEIKYLTDEFESLADLILECFPDVNTKEKLTLALKNSPYLSLIAVKDHNVVGHIMIDIRNDVVKNKTIFYLHYVCVSAQERNQGIGTALLKKVEELAKEKNVNSIEFTSNKRRLAAHNLYLKNNYLVRDTTYFHKEI